MAASHRRAAATGVRLGPRATAGQVRASIRLLFLLAPRGTRVQRAVAGPCAIVASRGRTRDK